MNDMKYQWEPSRPIKVLEQQVDNAAGELLHLITRVYELERKVDALQERARRADRDIEELERVGESDESDEA